VNRDDNAAANIRAIVLAYLDGNPRPDYLCRGYSTLCFVCFLSAMLM
jgi:hypothetical protein